MKIPIAFRRLGEEVAFTSRYGEGHGARTQNSEPAFHHVTHREGTQTC